MVPPVSPQGSNGQFRAEGRLTPGFLALSYQALGDKIRERVDILHKKKKGRLFFSEAQIDRNTLVRAEKMLKELGNAALKRLQNGG